MKLETIDDALALLTQIGLGEAYKQAPESLQSRVLDNITLIGNVDGDTIYNKCKSILETPPTPPVPEGFVDFGLPSGILWAKMNLGAFESSTPEDWLGDYYAWAELETKESYGWDEYKYANGTDNTLTKYCDDSDYGDEGFTDGLTTLESMDDAATHTNSLWKIPSTEECNEMIAHTVRASVEDYNGVKGLDGTLFHKAIITKQAFVADGVALYTVFDENMHMWDHLVKMTDSMLGLMMSHTKEELDIFISIMSEGAIADISKIIFKDNAGTLAEYGADYEFMTKVSDESSDATMFVPGSINIWTADLRKGLPDEARRLYIGGEKTSTVDWGERAYGCPIRPIMNKQ